MKQKDEGECYTSLQSHLHEVLWSESYAFGSEWGRSHPRFSSIGTSPTIGKVESLLIPKLLWPVFCLILKFG